MSANTKKEKAVFYVALNGNDQWSGRLPEPDSQQTDGPFATIPRAKEAVRKILSGGQKCSSVRVLIRGGRYELADPIVFTPDDSGTDTVPVAYAAYPGESSIISGGRVITGWKVEEVNGQRCWTVQLPEVAAGKWYFTQLFVNGMRRLRARLPKTGWYRFAGLPEGRLGMFKGTSSANYKAGEISLDWKHLQDIDLITLQHWFESHLKIKRIDNENNTVHFKVPSRSDLNDEKNEYARYCLENVFEALSEPGEWCLVSATGLLCYIPMPGEDIGNVEIIAPRLEKLLLLNGSDAGEKVRNLRFENLDFRHAEWRLPAEISGAVQAAFNVPGAIVFRAAENCALFGCSVSRIGQYAVEVQKGSFNNQIVACSLYDLGGGGVKINHERSPDATESKSSVFAVIDFEAEGWGRVGSGPIPGQDFTKGMRTTISDCEISKGGRIFTSACGILIGDSGRNRIRHNHISDFFYTGISCGWSWVFKPAYCMDNLIEFNHIHDIGQGMLSDMGGIYLLGRQPGTIVRGNHIHDVRVYGYGGVGLYNDGYGNAFIILEGNLVHHTQGSYFCNSGYGNILRNNILAMGGETTLEIADADGLVIEGNVLIAANLMGSRGYDSARAAANGNCYAFPIDAGRRWNGFLPAEWLEQDIDRNANFIDPLFLNPDSGDFRVRADSPLAGRAELFAWMAAGIRPQCGFSLPSSLDEWETRMKEKAGESFDRPLLELCFDVKIQTGHKELLFARPFKTEQVKFELINHGMSKASGDLEISLPKDFVEMEGPSCLHYELDSHARCDFILALMAKSSFPSPLRLVVNSRPGHFAPVIIRLLTDIPADEIKKTMLERLEKRGHVVLAMGAVWHGSSEKECEWIPGACFLAPKQGVIDRGCIRIDGAKPSLMRIYQNEAYCDATMTVAGRMPLPNGRYELTFHFAETFCTAKGKRAFDISINGKKWKHGVDVFDLAGGAFKALVMTNEHIEVVDGFLSIEVTGLGAMLNGIEIKKL